MKSKQPSSLTIENEDNEEQFNLTPPRDEQIGFLTRKLYQKNQAYWAKYMPGNLSSPQASVLLSLLEFGPQSISEVGSLGAMDPATTRGIVGRLRQKGLITTYSDPSDKRKVMLALLPAGKTALKDILPLLAPIAEKTLEPLNPAEQFALIFLLKKLTMSFDDVT